MKEFFGVSRREARDVNKRALRSPSALVQVGNDESGSRIRQSRWLLRWPGHGSQQDSEVRCVSMCVCGKRRCIRPLSEVVGPKRKPTNGGPPERWVCRMGLRGRAGRPTFGKNLRPHTGTTPEVAPDAWILSPTSVYL